MATYVLKTEPSEYSFSDLAKAKQSAWTGVSNATARGHLRKMCVGDVAFIYHTGDEKAMVGVAKVVRAAYGDPAATKAGGPLLNGKGEIAAPVVDVAAVRGCKPISLMQIKADRRFADCALVTQGRLSVVLLTNAQAAALEELAK
jgi:predicted RNA-binding protein with PUA-like domain